MDDRDDPLTCAVVSKTLVIAATQFDARDYFEVAKCVMYSLCDKFEFTSSGVGIRTSGSTDVTLRPSDAMFIIDALLVLTEYEWDSKLYGVATSLWEAIVASGLDGKYETYRKLQFLEQDQPKDFNSVPDLFPILITRVIDSQKPRC